MLVEFASVVDAVACAVAIQRGMVVRNAGVENDQRIDFRVGVNLGDVIVEEGDIFGDGVNVAARLEARCDPGGLCMSSAAHDQVRDKLAVPFVDLGEYMAKNIARPIRVFGLGSSEIAALPERAMPASSGSQGKVTHVNAAQPVLVLPDKPSIAVLPFANMSSDRDQDHFADGMSEDLITALSHIRWLFVIARNSSFVYRGQAFDVKRVAAELGVRYLLEGSVRKTGNRIRITAQLIDALTGAHHWAERYDRDVTDIFALQDEIVQQVVAAIEPRLLAAEGLRSQTRASADLDAWDMVARAMSRYWRFARPDIDAAIDLLKEAAARHPDYGPAHSMLAFALVLAGHVGALPTFEPPTLAIQSARRAVELDDRDPWAYLALGYVAFMARQTDDSVAQFQKAIELNPNFAAAHGYLGYPLAFAGRSEEAIASLSLAIRLSPHDRQNSIFMAGLAVAHYLSGRYDQAIEWGRKGLQQDSGGTGNYRILCASLAQAGRIEEARAMLVRVRELQPHISLAWVESMIPYPSAQMPLFLDGLRKAGLT